MGRWSSDVRRDVIRGSAVCYVAGGLWRSAERSAQENRSFDHYYGTLSGVRGFSDPHVRRLPNGRNVFDQPDPSNPDGYLLPYRLNTKITAAQAIPSMSHEWNVQHEALNGGKNDNWVPAHMASDGAIDGQYTMGYFTRDDIPFQFALAEAFTTRQPADGPPPGAGPPPARRLISTDAGGRTTRAAADLRLRPARRCG